MATTNKISSIFAAGIVMAWVVMLQAADTDDSVILYDRAISSFLSELKNKKTIESHDLDELKSKDARDGIMSGAGDFFAEAEFLALDKVMAKAKSFVVKTAEPFFIENIKIELYGCWVLSGRSGNGSMALLKIFYTGAEADRDIILFSGWMFSKFYTLGVMTHATYDVRLVSCRF